MKLIDYINSENRSFMLPFMGTNGLQLTGYTIYEVYNSPLKQLEVAKKMDELFGSDFIYAMDDGNIFCEVLGADLKKTDNDFPIVIGHPIKNLDDLKKYSVPNPYKEGRMAINLESLKLIASSFDKPLFVSLQGPFTLAAQLAEVTHLAKAIIKDPKFVRELLNFTTEVVLTYAKAIEKIGVKYISVAEPTAVIISPKRFDYLVGNNLNRIYRELNCWKGLHICGDTTAYFGNFLKCDIDSISLDQIMDLSEAIKVIPKEIVIVGNIDPLNVLASMTPEEVEKETLSLIKKMEEHRNFLLAFGCTCLNSTSKENLIAVTRAGKIKYNKS